MSVFKSATRREIYGYLCVHYAIRWLMHTVALDADTDPDRLSFTRTLRAARRTTHRNRAAARVVKRKMSGYGVKTQATAPGPSPAAGLKAP